MLSWIEWLNEHMYRILLHKFYRFPIKLFTSIDFLHINTSIYTDNSYVCCFVELHYAESICFSCCESDSKKTYTWARTYHSISSSCWSASSLKLKCWSILEWRVYMRWLFANRIMNNNRSTSYKNDLKSKEIKKIIRNNNNK